MACFQCFNRKRGPVHETIVIARDQNYKEQLILKFLPDGNVLAHFEHKISWQKSPTDLAYSKFPKLNHLGIFPRPIADAISSYKVQELHLSLTRSKWKNSLWGLPPIESPPGAEFWTWFLPDTSDIGTRWTGLVNAVSGFMCASLKSVNSLTYEPFLPFRPEGAFLVNMSSNVYRYMALPREAVCTENFTPWSKLLPCGQKAGLGSMYEEMKLFDSLYHSLSLKVIPVCENSNCSLITTNVFQAISIVLDPGWSFQSLFAKKLMNNCPLASHAYVYVDFVSSTPLFNLSPHPTTIKEIPGSVKFAVYDLKNYSIKYPLDISFTNFKLMESVQHYTKMVNMCYIAVSYAPLLQIQRFVTGSGHERGSLVLTITNNDKNKTILLSTLDMVPWYFRLLYHTLQLSCKHDFNNKDCNENLVLYHRYTSGKDRERPHTIEYLLSVSPSSTITIYIQFLRAFLKWNEYPPDASHGFYINSAVITAVFPSCHTYTFFPLLEWTLTNRSCMVRMYSEPLLVSIPIPDFSMPYNVICFISTVVAIGFGSLFNLTTKTLTPDTSTGLTLFKFLKR